MNMQGRLHKQNLARAQATAARRAAQHAEPDKRITFSRTEPCTNIVLLNGASTVWYVERVGSHIPGKRTGLWRAQRRGAKPDPAAATYPTRLDAARAVLGLA